MTDIYALLAELGISYDRYDHAPVMTCEEADAAVPERDAAHTKNLFLRDKRGRRHLLVVTTCAKSVDLKRLAAQMDADNLSFASPERMAKYLGVSPGAVTILGLANDVEHSVELIVDADVWNAATWRAHPLVNSATLVLKKPDIVKFLSHTGHAPRVVAIEDRGVTGNP
ncbi:MAG TPA: prolyl-tRNA synthetase associated domain-containing protein [Gemmatimonadaceae bacterium]|nr:prolyl-tRNA synthetase associated domain-containing protein [Gemmatimonadaceae bacterium]